MQLLQQIINGLMLGGILAFVAVAFTLTIGMLNFLNFTIPALFMIAGMATWALSSSGSHMFAWGWHWAWAACAGITLAVLASLLIERFTYRYMKARFGDATEHALPLVSSLGFLIVFEHLAMSLWGAAPQRFELPFKDSNLRIGGLIFADPDIAKILGPDGEDATYVSWYWWDTNELTRQFERKFLDEAKKRGVNKSGAHHVDASAYDIVYVYADAMRRAGISGDASKLKAERTAIRDTLQSTNIDGVIGKICFSRDRDSELPAFIIRIKNGQRTLLDSHAPDRCA